MLRSALRLAGNRRSVGLSGAWHKLMNIDAPTFESQDHLGRVYKSGSRSAVAVEPTKNRISTTHSSIALHAYCTHEHTLTIVPQPLRPIPNPTAHG